MGIWKQDGTFDTGWFVETVSNPRNLRQSIDLMSGLETAISDSPWQFSVEAVKAFIGAAHEIALIKPTTIGERCWHLINELDKAQVALAEEGYRKNRFSVGPEEIVSILGLSIDPSLRWIDPDRPKEIFFDCFVRHSDYRSAVGNSVMKRIYGFPEGAITENLAAIWCEKAERGFTKLPLSIQFTPQVG